MGPFHSALITTSGDLYTFGSGSYGKLGQGNSSDHWEPTLVEFFSQQKLKIKDVVCGKYQTLILDQEGGLWACGYGGNQLTMRPAFI
jgi:alpha-tubulin suppressor-like RCC1 family protein